MHKYVLININIFMNTYDYKIIPHSLVAWKRDTQPVRHLPQHLKNVSVKMCRVFSLFSSLVGMLN